MSDIYIGDRINNVASAIRETAPCKHEWGKIEESYRVPITIYYQKCEECGLINVIHVRE